MRDGFLERAFVGGPRRVGMYPLVIERGVGELVDHRLLNLQVIGDTHGLAHILFKLLKASD